MLEARRFPPPWTVEDIRAAFVVTDSAGQKLTSRSREFGAIFVAAAFRCTARPLCAVVSVLAT